MTVQDDDQFLVCRNSTPYNLKSQNVMAELLDDDLMLVCRAGNPYEATGLEIKESIGPQEAPPSLTSVTLTEDTPGGSRFDNQSFTSTLNWATKGVPEASLEMQATVTGTLDIAGTTDEIVGIGTATTVKSWNTGNPGFIYSNNDQTISRVDAGYGYTAVANSAIPAIGSTSFSFTHQTTDANNPRPVFTTVVNETRASNSDRGGYVDTQTDGWAYVIDDTKVVYYKNGSEVGRKDGGTPYNTGLNTTNEFEITITRNGTTQVWAFVNKTNGYSDTYAFDDTYAGDIYMAFTSNNYNQILTVNGTVNTAFTLASDVNLANGVFQAGDTVKQNNSPLTPTSSAITNVATTGPASEMNVLQAPDNTYASQPNITVVVDKGDTTSSWTTIGDVTFTTNIPGNGSSIAAWQTNDFITWDRTTSINWGGPQALGLTASYRYAAFASALYSSGVPAGNSITGTCTFADPNVNLVSLDTTLTLTNSDGLDEFQVGDVVQESGPAATALVYAQANDEDQGAYFNYFTSSFQFSGWLITDLVDDSLLVGKFTWSLFYDAGAGWIKKGNYNSDEPPGSIPGGNSDVSFTIYGQSGVGEAKISLTGVEYVGTVGTLPADNPFGTKASITAIDPSAPSITTDGGSWKGTDGTGEVAWDQSQSWSNFGIGTPFSNTYSWIKVFDGDINNGSMCPTDGQTASWLPSSLPVTTLRIYGERSTAGLSWTINGNSVTNVPVGLPAWFTPETGTPITVIDSITFYTEDGGNASILHKVEVNGDLLVDSGVSGAPPNPETFVTGPTTDITATYVSADPSVPSMTVSDVVGPWSANTGNYVENTVVNPILIKPETSAITAVNSAPVNDWSEASTMSGNKEASFDGDTGTGGGSIGESDCVVLGLDTTISQSLAYWSGNTSGVSSYWTYTRSDGTEETVTLLSGDKVDGGWTTVPLPSWSRPFTCQKIEARRASSSEKINAVRVDSTILIDLPVGTILTLQNDTDLAQFATGDNVYAADVAPASFAPVLYTGNAGTQDISCGFAPDLVWLKARGTGGITDHGLYDTLRGAGTELYSDLTNGTTAAATALTSFNADGFSIGSSNMINDGSNTYVAWCWDAGGTTVTNNEGTIESQVRSNGQFSIVKYPGDPVGAKSVGHGLSDVPALIIAKNISNGVFDWPVFHTSLGVGSNTSLKLNTSGNATSNYFPTEPTSSVFNTTSSGAIAGGSGEEMIAYCWADSPTQSFGSYAGGTVGTAINCGFAPSFVMIKNATGTGGWTIFDTARSSADPNNVSLEANLSDEEVVYSPRQISFTSTGFSLEGLDSWINIAGDSYIYAAFSSAGGPSGVISDITGLDMTLSESSGTWEVGQKVTKDEGPAISTTANLIFNSSGTVSGLSTQPVAGQLMSNKDTPKLTFGDGAGTGETWDQELPAGTHLQTSFVATNIEGTSSATSNEITP